MNKFRLEDLLVRPTRLTILTVLAAFAFVYGRLILFAILGLLILFAAIKTYIKHRKSHFKYIIPVMLMVLILGIYYIVEYNQVIRFRNEHSPLDLEWIEDGTYQGTAQGLRGPIKTEVTIAGGILQEIEIKQHQ
ncbi:hypothetical protein GF337_18880, partial [candidate division KSB1 bacterium]|nr:hypothetical protein [candidate division KSB1 bacterium]